MTTILKGWLPKDVCHDALGIVVARNAVYGRVQRLNSFAKYFITLPGLILHQVACCKNRIGFARVVLHALYDCLQRIEGINTAHSRVTMSVQVSVSQMKKANWFGHDGVCWLQSAQLYRPVPAPEGTASHSHDRHDCRASASSMAP